MDKYKTGKEMYTIQEIHIADIFWYGNTSLDSCCLAENRLMRGEAPEDLQGNSNEGF